MCAETVPLRSGSSTQKENKEGVFFQPRDADSSLMLHTRWGKHTRVALPSIKKTSLLSNKLRQDKAHHTFSQGPPSDTFHVRLRRGYNVVGHVGVLWLNKPDFFNARECNSSVILLNIICMFIRAVDFTPTKYLVNC